MWLYSGCGCKEVYGIIIYVDFLSPICITIITTPLVSALFGRISPTFCSLYKKFFVFFKLYW